MLEGLLSELRTLTELSIVPVLAASSLASWMIFRYRARLQEFMMSRRRIRDKRHAEWSLIANEFTLKLHEMKIDGKIHNWAYYTLIKKMRGLGMDLSIEPTFGKPWYTKLPSGDKLKIALLKLKVKLLKKRIKPEEAPVKRKNSLEDQFNHCRKTGMSGM